MSEFHFVSHVKSTCPCGKSIEVGDAILDDRKVPCVIHEEPHCRTFADLDVIDYLHWVNVMKGNHN